MWSFQPRHKKLGTFLQERVPYKSKYLANYTNRFLKNFIFFALTAYIPTTATIFLYYMLYVIVHMYLYLFVVVSSQQLLSIWVQFVATWYRIKGQMISKSIFFIATPSKIVQKIEPEFTSGSILPTFLSSFSIHRGCIKKDTFWKNLTFKVHIESQLLSCVLNRLVNRH